MTFHDVNENGQADIAGVPDELLTLWSKRTANIDAEAGPKIAEYEKLLGRTLSSSERVGVVKTAVLKTRARKQHSELSALHTTWTAEATQAGWTPDRLRRAVRLRTPPARGGREPGVLPTDPAGRSGLAEPNRPQVPGTDRHGPHQPVALLSARDSVLPADGDGLPVDGDALPADDDVLPGDGKVLPIADGVLPAGVAAGALQGAGTRRAVFFRAALIPPGVVAR